MQISPRGINFLGNGYTSNYHSLQTTFTQRAWRGLNFIAGYTWAFVYQKPRDAARSRALVQVMTWVLTDGQVYASSLNYVPLPGAISAV